VNGGVAAPLSADFERFQIRPKARYCRGIGRHQRV
jgi:hypothetical protein